MATQKQNNRHMVLLPASLSLVLTGAVLLSSTHAKDVMAMTAPGHMALSKTTTDDGAGLSAKAAAELHDHSHKPIKVMNSSDSSMQTDGRSLRLLHDQKKNTSKPQLGERLLDWWYSHSVYLTTL